VRTGLLSRIAETLFWTGRYIERADDTARVVDAYVQSLLGEPHADEDAGCRALLGILGLPEPVDDGRLDLETALGQLAYERASHSAIAGAVLAARAGARSAREVISSEMWECLNITAHDLPAQRRAADRLGPHVYLRFVRERAALFFGLADSTMSHDDAWLFLELGRSLERTDMTARLLLARTAAASHKLSWTTLLHACGAYESFVRTRSQAADVQRVPEFLILDRMFPRSVLRSLATAEDCLAGLEPGRALPGIGDPARRPIGRLRTSLEYADPELLPGQLPELLTTLQQACMAASDAITDRYFTPAHAIAWEHEG
jgi:uncharacterized alpha-E superfamily protein